MQTINKIKSALSFGVILFMAVPVTFGQWVRTSNTVQLSNPATDKLSAASTLVLSSGYYFNFEANSTSTSATADVFRIKSAKNNTFAGALFRVDNASGNQFYIKGTGDVGIGTIAPSAKMHIYSTTGSAPLLKLSNVTEFGGQYHLTLTGSDINSAGVLFLNNNSATGVSIAGAGGDVIIGRSNAHRLTINNVIAWGLGFEATTADKISLYGDRLGATNMYGFGVESTCIYQKSMEDHRWYSGANADGGTSALMTLKGNGNLGIGTNSPAGKVEISYNSGVNGQLQLTEEDNDYARLVYKNNQPGQWHAAAKASGTPASAFYNIWFDKGDGNGTNLLSVRGDGNVGIGTNALTGFKLSVDGKIRAREIVVNLSSWADFVFDQNYILKPLTEVETFIKQHKHLPEIPSAKEVETNGVAVGEMEAKLLMKVEELTLYIIDLQKQVDALKASCANNK